MTKQYVAYYRVSTQRQGRSGLGLEAQRAAVAAFVADGAWVEVAQFEEQESGKGADALARRPRLLQALQLCKKKRATLVIAKLDRLARNVHFVSGLIEAGVEFVAVDMPTATKAMLQIYAVMAEHERDQIMARTKAALAAAKVRGAQLGATGPANLRPHLHARISASIAFSERLRGVMQSMQASGVSQRGMAVRLNELGIRAPAGGAWSQVQVQRVLRRVAEARGSIAPSTAPLTATRAIAVGWRPRRRPSS